MKVLISIASLVLFLFGVVALQAQPGGKGRGADPEKRAEQQTNLMQEKLSLSEAQTEKVKTINLKYAQKMKEAREKADGDWEAMRSATGALREEQDKELQTVMTKEQWQQWAQYREERRGNRGGYGPGNQPEDKAPPSEDGEKKPKKDKKKKKNKSDADAEQ